MPNDEGTRHKSVERLGRLRDGYPLSTGEEGEYKGVMNLDFRVKQGKNPKPESNAPSTFAERESEERELGLSRRKKEIKGD